MGLDYNVVLENLVGEYKGVYTISSFNTKEDFDNWYKGNDEDGQALSELLGIVAEGISDREAERMCFRRYSEIMPSLLIKKRIELSELTNSIIDSLKN